MKTTRCHFTCDRCSVTMHSDPTEALPPHWIEVSEDIITRHYCSYGCLFDDRILSENRRLLSENEELEARNASLEAVYSAAETLVTLPDNATNGIMEGIELLRSRVSRVTQRRGPSEEGT